MKFLTAVYQTSSVKTHGPSWELVVAFIASKWPISAYVLHVLHISNAPSALLLCVSDDEEENREVDASAGRFVRYQFTPAFLKLRTVGATWVTCSPLPPVDDHSVYFTSTLLCGPTGWNSQLGTDPWTISGWSSGTTSAITCWRASTLTLGSVSQTVETPVSTFMSSPSCLRAWVSHFNQVTLPVCHLHCFGAENVIKILIIIIIKNDSGIPL